MLHVVKILATLYFIQVITLLFRFTTDSVPDPLDDTLQVEEEGASRPEQPQDPKETRITGVQQVVITGQCLRIDDPHALDEVISLHYDALGYYNVMHACRGQLLGNLSVMLMTRFERRGSDDDLDEAITLQSELLVSHPVALALRPVGHTDRSMSLNNLANQLSTRFDHRGNAEDLDEAIALHREALALRPSLNNLANRFSTRFDHRGNADDLDEAIALHREALALHPVGHTDRSMSLNNLAVQLSARFDHRGNAEDLDVAIALQREALALHPVGHTDRSMSLNNLANRLSTRFDRRGNAEDLDEAIALHREALALRPVGHTYRSSSLNNLANRLSTRFDHRGSGEDLNESRENLLCNAEDLDEAIALHREALVLHPVGHTYRSMSLNNLALELSTRFDRRGNGDDLDEAIALHREALALHPSLATVYLSFHRSGLDGARPGEDTDSLNAAMQHFKAAANVVPGGLQFRLRVCLRWVLHADQHKHDTVLEAYGTSMQLLDAYMSATGSVSPVNAASCALRSGDVRRAVELLEQGRTIIWTQMTRLRTPLDSLQTRGDHAVTLMKRFRDLSSLLDKPSASHADATQSVDDEVAATRYRRVVEDWNGVVEEIRTIEGFSRFLLPPLFSDFQEAARDGPVVMLIASRSSCDAIIIPHQQPPTSIQLPTNFENLSGLMLALREAVEKEAGPKGNQPALTKVLRKLWDVVVRPVVKKLVEFAPRGSRIWWCPTSVFNFLPLHAAGEYRANGESLSQLYISSYTPSLTALMRARRSHDRCPSCRVSARDARPAAAGAAGRVKKAAPELVQRLLPPPPTVSLTKITSVDATRSTALRALRDNTWLHFSCHGTQNHKDPFIGVLTTPDEVIHLAAGLQFAGVQSVVGTLWKVNDWTVQRLVEAFYKNMCGDGTMNSKRAARALHQAVNSLARDKDIPLDQRIVFMHIGI
ncbi:hypothetical protein P692DRAFT_201848294 [Suillus brevipes Sb2]|nr:hypothetical protein P692DRAFT_201848294 [Suillus brevipes Sb2]